MKIKHEIDRCLQERREMHKSSEGKNEGREVRKEKYQTIHGKHKERRDDSVYEVVKEKWNKGNKKMQWMIERRKKFKGKEKKSESIKEEIKNEVRERNYADVRRKEEEGGKLVTVGTEKLEEEDFRKQKRRNDLKGR